jgi:hypothetical protein
MFVSLVMGSANVLCLSAISGNLSFGGCITLEHSFLSFEGFGYLDNGISSRSANLSESMRRTFIGYLVAV